MGALALEARGITSVPPVRALVGFGAAFVVGLVCLYLLAGVVRRGELHWFAAYCIPAGACAIVAGACL